MSVDQNERTKIPVDTFLVHRNRELYKLFFWIDCFSGAVVSATVYKVIPDSILTAILVIIVLALAATMSVLSRIYYYKLSVSIARQHIAVYILLSLIPFVPWFLFFSILSESGDALNSGYASSHKKLIKNYRKFFGTVLLIGYIASLLTTSVFWVPKYIMFHEVGGVVDSGYYPIWGTHSSGWPGWDIVMGDAHYTYTSHDLDLYIDYSQWFMITFIETMVLLLPSVVLFKTDALRAYHTKNVSAKEDV